MPGACMKSISVVLVRPAAWMDGGGADVTSLSWHQISLHRDQGGRLDIAQRELVKMDQTFTGGVEPTDFDHSFSAELEPPRQERGDDRGVRSDVAVRAGVRCRHLDQPILSPRPVCPRPGLVIETAGLALKGIGSAMTFTFSGSAAACRAACGGTPFAAAV